MKLQATLFLALLVIIAQSESLRCFQCSTNIPGYDPNCESNPHQLTQVRCPSNKGYCHIIHSRPSSVSTFQTIRGCVAEPLYVYNEPPGVSYYYCNTDLCNTANTTHLAGVLVLLVAALAMLL